MVSKWKNKKYLSLFWISNKKFTLSNDETQKFSLKASFLFSKIWENFIYSQDTKLKSIEEVTKGVVYSLFIDFIFIRVNIGNRSNHIMSLNINGYLENVKLNKKY